LWIFFWGILLTPLSLGLGLKPKRQAPGGTGSPIWTIDLRSVGFTGFAPKQEQWGIHLKPNPLCFVDNKTLIATFVTREEITTLARRDQPSETSPLRLHAVFLDPEVGIVLATKEWPVTRPRGGVIATGAGRFAVLTPAMIALYSPSRELLKDLKFSSAEQSDLWDLHSSPSGKSIVAEYHTPEAYFQRIDTNTLTRRPTSIPTVVFSISDEDVAIARNPYVQSKGFLDEVLVQTADGPWQPICSAPSGQAGNCGQPEFVSNNVVALLTPHGFNLVPKAGGDPLLRVAFHDDDWLGHPLYPSADGARFAATVWAHKGGSEFFDIGSQSVLKRVVVYDIPSRQAVYTLDAKQQKMRNVSGIALSPDGSLLAVSTEGLVRVYQLPEVGRVPQGQAD